MQNGSTDLATILEPALELSTQDVAAQVAKIQDLMNKVMQKDQHYGTIPGCGDKPTLLKPGAEKINYVFRIRAEYQINKTLLDNNHREYEVITTLVHMVSGMQVGQGVGICSTMESKYRWRKGLENTGKPVPKEYWKDRDQALIGGRGFSTKKDDDGKWMIFKSGEKVEHPDIADTYNTVLKMAKKRSLVDATINATAASDIFTQDIEDFLPEQTTPPQKPEPPKQTTPEPKLGDKLIQESAKREAQTEQGERDKLAAQIGDTFAMMPDLDKAIEWIRAEKKTRKIKMDLTRWYVRVLAQEKERNGWDLLGEISAYNGSRLDNADKWADVSDKRLNVTYAKAKERLIQHMDELLAEQAA